MSRIMIPHRFRRRAPVERTAKRQDAKEFIPHRYQPPDMPAFRRRQIERRVAPFIGKDVIYSRKRWHPPRFVMVPPEPERH